MFNKENGEIKNSKTSDSFTAMNFFDKKVVTGESINEENSNFILDDSDDLTSAGGLVLDDSDDLTNVGGFVLDDSDSVEDDLSDVINSDNNLTNNDDLNLTQKNNDEPVNKKVHGVCDYKQINHNVTNFIHVNTQRVDDYFTKITDAEKLTPICLEFLKSMIKKGYYPQKETFAEYCCRNIAEIFNGYTENEINSELSNLGNQVDNEFSQIELSALSQYLRMERNIHLDRTQLARYVRFPLQFFNCIAFPFRKASYNEISDISEVYTEEWYVDYIIPLFSLEESDTPLIISLMKKREFDEKEALQYVSNVKRLKEYLTLKNNGGYSKEVFNMIGSNQNDYDLYELLLSIVGDQDIVLDLFHKNSKEKNQIVDYLKKLDSQFNNKIIKLKNGKDVNFIEFLREYRKDPNLIYLMKGLCNGIFDINVYHAIMNCCLENKLVVLSLLNLYSTNNYIGKYYSANRDIFISILSAEIEKYGYDINKFTQDIKDDFNSSDVQQIVYIICLFYSNIRDFNECDYKQWLALFSMDYRKYITIILKNTDCDYFHFNKFWAMMVVKYFGFKDISIDTDVQRTMVFKFANNLQSNLPLDAFIYMDDRINSILTTSAKPHVNMIKYDKEKKILFIGNNRYFKDYTVPLVMLKTSLENIGREDIKEFCYENRTELIMYYNLLKLKDTAYPFISKGVTKSEIGETGTGDSIADQLYRQYINNFTYNCKNLISIPYFDYIYLDTFFHVINSMEKEYSLLAFCADVNVFHDCLMAFKNIYRDSSDSLILFTRFILFVYGVKLTDLGQFCKYKCITVINENRINSMYNNPITLEIFLKEIVYFYKSAKNIETVLSIDESTGGMCVDYKLQ